MKDPALETRARTLSSELRCLVCQNELIDDSEAPLARDIRVLIRERIGKGESNDSVRAYLVSRYGDFILLKPPFKPETLLLWLSPVLTLSLGLAAALFARRRAPSTTPRLSDEEEARLGTDRTRRIRTSLTGVRVDGDGHDGEPRRPSEEIEVAEVDAGVLPRGRRVGSRRIFLASRESTKGNGGALQMSIRPKPGFVARDSRASPNLVHVRSRKMPMPPDCNEAQNEAGRAPPINAEALAPSPIRRATTRTAEPMIAAVARKSTRNTAGTSPSRMSRNVYPPAPLIAPIIAAAIGVSLYSSAFSVPDTASKARPRASTMVRRVLAVPPRC